MYKNKVYNKSLINKIVTNKYINNKIKSRDKIIFRMLIHSKIYRIFINRKIIINYNLLLM